MTGMTNPTTDEGGGKPMGLTKVQARGQITIPAEVRRAGNIETGDTVLVKVLGDGRLELRVLPGFKKNHVERYMVPGVAPDKESLEKAVAEEIAKEVKKGRDYSIETIREAIKEAAATQEYESA